ncbi:hypothetical protein RRG08_063677 [Elysia crispata]|uniref:Uncharacterized protein n=1 Tax=Elysia crispata TaxID=231223 RepID=A0AAE0ZAJ9_9GAST|nr:hypothetical protein RRG08_063677 [Elysia crispata]
MVKVLDDGDESDAFQETNGVKQDCVIALILFSMMFSAMLTDAFHACDDGTPIRYSMNGRLFNLRRLQAVRLSSETFCLPTTAPSTPEQNSRCRMKWTTAQVNNRIAKASDAFGKLCENVWERRGCSLTTKLKVYHAVVLTTLLYASETWTVYSRHARKLNHFHLSCLHRLLRIRWQEKIPDTEVRSLSEPTCPESSPSNRKHRPDGLDAPSGCLTADCRNIMLYSELCQGKRTMGEQKKRFKDNLKTSKYHYRLVPYLRTTVQGPD